MINLIHNRKNKQQKLSKKFGQIDAEINLMQRLNQMTLKQKLILQILHSTSILFIFYILYPVLIYMIDCATDSDCPFLFYCGEQLKCAHKPIFPFQVYTVFVYLLIPIGSGLVNITGKSMGIVKVDIMMNLLRYSASQSTALIQPMVAGSALPNVLSVIFKRHPFRNTSLIDFDIILVTIPCCLLGSTLGSFLEKLIPEIIKDLAVIAFFGVFAFRFYIKAKSFEKNNPLQDSNQQPLHQDVDKLSSNITQSQQLQKIQLSPQLNEKKNYIEEYEKSYHIPDILISLIVFMVFQFMVFLIRGKFSFFQAKVCSWPYIISLIILVLIVVVYLELIRRALHKRYSFYRLIGKESNMDFSEKRSFGLICFGGYFAGLVQGILGVGSGTFIMGTFMALNLNPKVAAATSGYQILFIGMAAFIAQFTSNNITLSDAAFLFLLTFIGGGLFTNYLYYRLRKIQERRANKILLMLMFWLCLVSSLSMIPFFVQVVYEFGWAYLIKIPFQC